jgi:hypothetical protein
MRETSDERFTIVVCVNNDDVLQKNLLLSPGILNGGRNQLSIRRHFSSASLAYNSAVDESANDIIIFVHQDVYLPDTWFEDLKRCLAWLDAANANWGVLGCYGCRVGVSDGLGRLYTTGHGPHGRQLAHPEPVDTLDELILIIRKSSGLRFDPRLSHFHLYGADICMTAREKGMVNYAFQGYCVHNTNKLLILPREFYTGYHYLRRKWRHRLPIATSCMRISLLNEELYRRRIYEVRLRVLGRTGPFPKRVDDPRILSRDRDCASGMRADTERVAD